MRNHRLPNTLRGLLFAGVVVFGIVKFLKVKPTKQGASRAWRDYRGTVGRYDVIIYDSRSEDGIFLAQLVCNHPDLAPYSVVGTGLNGEIYWTNIFIVRRNNDGRRCVAVRKSENDPWDLRIVGLSAETAPRFRIDELEAAIQLLQSALVQVYNDKHVVLQSTTNRPIAHK